MKEDAKACQEFGQQVTVADTKKEDPQTVPGKPKGGGGRPGRGKGKGTDDGKEKKTVCLYPLHRQKGLKRYIKDCKKCSEEDKDKYLQKYIEERKASGGKAQIIRNDGALKRKPADGEESYLLFTAVFGSTYRDKVCADNGADGYINDRNTLLRISAVGVEVSVEKLKQPRVFEMATANSNGADAKPAFSKGASIDTDLKIRHGSTLRLINLKWLVTDQRVADPLLGHPIIEALGLNTRNLLTAAADQFFGSAYDDRLIELIIDTDDRRVSRVIEGVSHAEGGEDLDDDQDKSGEWCDIGDESTEEWEKCLREKLAEAE